LEEEIGDSDKEGLLIFIFRKIGVSRSATACIKGSNLSKVFNAVQVYTFTIDIKLKDSAFFLLV
jgi:hypothetical protein